MRLRLIIGTVALTALAAGLAWAGDGVGDIKDGVPSANLRVGAPATVVDPDFQLKVIATGIEPLENPSGLITH